MLKKQKKENNQVMNKQKKKKKAIKIPKTVQDTIPYVNVYPNGIIETEPGEFTKIYPIEDVNFKIANQEDQTNIFTDYGRLLNSLDAETRMQVVIHNRNIDQEQFIANTLLKYNGDGLDSYREEYNQMLMNKMNEGHNNLTREKYIVISITEENVDSAITTFQRIDGDISSGIKRINGKETKPLGLFHRLSILYDMFNLDAEISFESKANIQGHDAEAFNYKHMKKLGLTTKDLIAPEGIEFKKDYMKLGEVYARVLYLDNLPTYLSTNLLSDITSLPCNMVTSIHITPLRQDQALKMITNQMTSVNANIIDAQKKASKNGYSPDLIPPKLAKAQDETDKLISDMTSRNQKMYLISTIMMVYGKTKEELDQHTKELKTIGQKHLCQIKNLLFQQEYGLATVLPFANNKLFVHRLLTTESASVFIPFSNKELSQKNGMYYGLNAESNNLILFNRLNSKNANGVILGTPGSGKSFSAKREMINVLLNTNDEIFILDPEREYTPLAELLGGEIVKIKPDSSTHINPLDMDINYGDDADGAGDPITLKADYIISLCETLLKGSYFTPIHRSVIDRCVRLVYADYIEYMKTVNSNVTCDYEKMPTLVDLYDCLIAQPEPEAQNIAIALEMYAIGSLNTFAHRTNVNTKSRLTVYDIKEIGTGMKELGLQVCMNDMWNRTIANHAKGKRTWCYMDEFYLLTQTDLSAKFLQQIYKRARKWGGILTGITQNVEDLLASKEARGIINNCDFIMMLNQSPLDRAELCNMLNISEAQAEYVTNSPVGQGLLYTGDNSVIPFIDQFPTDTQLYKVMTTKPEETSLLKNAA